MKQRPLDLWCVGLLSAVWCAAPASADEELTKQPTSEAATDTTVAADATSPLTAPAELVFYAELAPKEFRERIAKAPIAYLPPGTLEWHGDA